MDKITIENEDFSAAIALHGAQVVSLADTSSGQQLIWQRNADFWAESAPILFPVVGFLQQDGRYVFDGKSYQMPKHGVVRHAEFVVSDQGVDYVCLTSSATDQTRQAYPFDFKLVIEFRLSSQGLSITATVHNQGRVSMPVSFGYHPAIALDLENYSLSDYEISFDPTASLGLYGLRAGGVVCLDKDYLPAGATIPLSEAIFDEDALIFKDIIAQRVSVQRPKDGWSVAVDTGGAEFLGVWSKPKAAYVCIEPWHICPDGPESPLDITAKQGITMLAAGDSKAYSMAIIVPA